jgi:hypothetical protein
LFVPAKPDAISVARSRANSKTANSLSTRSTVLAEVERFSACRMLQYDNYPLGARDQIHCRGHPRHSERLFIDGGHHIVG